MKYMVYFIHYEDLYTFYRNMTKMNKVYHGF